jgi:hypothetical protein
MESADGTGATLAWPLVRQLPPQRCCTWARRVPMAPGEDRRHAPWWLPPP